MTKNLNGLPAPSPATRGLCLAAAAVVTVSLFSSVVRLADDQPMAIAGHSSQRVVATKAANPAARVVVAKAAQPPLVAAR